MLHFYPLNDSFSLSRNSCHCVSTQKVTVAAGAVGVTGVGAQEPAMLFLHVAGSCETPGE